MSAQKVIKVCLISYDHTLMVNSTLCFDNMPTCIYLISTMVIFDTRCAPVFVTHIIANKGYRPGNEAAETYIIFIHFLIY